MRWSNQCLLVILFFFLECCSTIPRNSCNTEQEEVLQIKYLHPTKKEIASLSKVASRAYTKDEKHAWNLLFRNDGEESYKAWTDSVCGCELEVRKCITFCFFGKTQVYCRHYINGFSILWFLNPVDRTWFLIGLGGPATSLRDLKEDVCNFILYNLSYRISSIGPGFAGFQHAVDSFIIHVLTELSPWLVLDRRNRPTHINPRTLRVKGMYSDLDPATQLFCGHVATNMLPVRNFIYSKAKDIFKVDFGVDSCYYPTIKDIPEWMVKWNSFLSGLGSLEFNDTRLVLLRLSRVLNTSKAASLLGNENRISAELVESNEAINPSILKNNFFVDEWGRYIKCKKRPDGRLVLLSLGPNGQDEDGLGDDILADSEGLLLR